MTVREFIKTFSHSNEVIVENRNSKMMRMHYVDGVDSGEGCVEMMDWEVEKTDIAECEMIEIKNVYREGYSQAITFKVDTDREEFCMDKDYITMDNSPLWLYEKVHQTKVRCGEA